MSSSANSGKLNADLRFLYLSPASRYALLGMRAIALSRSPSGFELVAESAKRAGLPANSLAKIFQRLASRGLLISQRGPGGGYSLSKKPAQISLADILRSVQDIVPGGSHCLLGNQLCGKEDFCSIHKIIKGADRLVIKGFGSLSLEDLANDKGWRFGLPARSRKPADG